MVIEEKELKQNQKKIYSKIERISIYNSIKNRLSEFSYNDIEDAVMLYCLTDYNCNAFFYDSENARKIVNVFTNLKLPTDIETIVEFFESLLENDSRNENGIVFTPQYIADYMSNMVLSNICMNKNLPLLIDPCCGCGIFLVAAAETLLKNTNEQIDTIIEKCIYGIDIVPENVRRCNLILKLLSAKHGGNFENVKSNIVCNDSLKIDWNETFKVKSFDFIVGNPPYINPHGMNKEKINYLKEKFYSTQNGLFNIFYAFIEKGMQEINAEGILSYIIPNNFLTIKSAVKLREYLQKNLFIKCLIDFGENMIFKPVRTYNCIIQLTKKENIIFDYHVFPKVDNIKLAIPNIVFNRMETNLLDKNGWNLVDKKTYNNIKKIEKQQVPIKNFIRTGIATLCDNAYIVEKDDLGYYKIVNSKKIFIEPDLVKPLYKVPDLKFYDNIEDAKRYIIFPYTKLQSGYSLIDEKVFALNYPQTYKCLKMQRDKLDSRDKGRGVNPRWYAFGRTQGLNKYGKKLLFPTFANKPKFIYADDEESLFCNGYAVFENEKYDLDILSKILNSCLMDYYVSNTSYSIEGKYYCYQKKYIERFSLPYFSEEDLVFIRNASKYDLDQFLWTLYGLE